MQYLEQKQFIGTKIQFQNRSEGTINGYGEAFMAAVQKEVQSNWSEQLNARKNKVSSGHATQQ